MDTRDKARLTRIERTLEQILNLLSEQPKAVRYYTIREAAEAIGYSESYVRKLIKQGGIASVSTNGKKKLIPEEALVRYQAQAIS